MARFFAKPCVQNGRLGPSVALHDDVLRGTAGRLAADQFPCVDGAARRAAEKADAVPARRSQVVVRHDPRQQSQRQVPAPVSFPRLYSVAYTVSASLAISIIERKCSWYTTVAYPICRSV